jgi:uncharacterized membrane protein YphA (DoxX/SURF4 family)
MKGFENITYLVAYIISNIVAILLLWAAWKQPRIARLMFFLLFAWAGWTNWTTALRNPQFYIEYADLSFWDVYKQFIRGWFSIHVTQVVSFIAICQALIAVSMLLKGWFLKIGVVGAIVFLLAIAPLGVGSAFPFSITASIALYLILRNQTNDYLWINPKIKYHYSH